MEELKPSKPEAAPLARLKGALVAGYPRGVWSFSALFLAVLPRLPGPRQAFFQALGYAILDAGRVPALDDMKQWKELQALDPFSA